MKKNKHITRTTVVENNVKYEGDVSTPTAHLETEKISLTAFHYEKRKIHDNMHCQFLSHDAHGPV